MVCMVVLVDADGHRVSFVVGSACVFVFIYLVECSQDDVHMRFISHTIKIVSLGCSTAK